MATPAVIGFTLDHETSPSYSRLPWYAIRENYLHAASDLGAVPIALPYAVNQVEPMLDILSGLVIIGGDFDIDPKLYGSDKTHERIHLKPQRTAFEWAITEGALARQMPILGICGGQQLLTVVLGGTLIYHIPDVISSPIAHEQPNPRHEVGHMVSVEAETLLHRLVGCQEIGVNSAHHQAVDQPGAQLIVSGRAPDGIIEAVELPASEHPFCLGVQWHPEYHVSPADDTIWQGFVSAAEAYRR